MSQLLNLSGSKLITVLVGPTQQPYSLHKDVLCTHSPFFASCLNSSFREATTDTVTLPTDSPEIFDHFVHWAYREDVTKLTDQPSVETAIRTYVLADRLCMPRWKNYLVSQIRQYHVDRPLHLQSLILWRSLEAPADLPLEHFLVDQAGHDMSRHPRRYFQRANGSARLGDVDVIAEEHGEVLADVLWAVLNPPNRYGEAPALRRGCCYHEHADAYDKENCPEHVAELRRAKDEAVASKSRRSFSRSTSHTEDPLADMLRAWSLLPASIASNSRSNTR